MRKEGSALEAFIVRLTKIAWRQTMNFSKSNYCRVWIWLKLTHIVDQSYESLLWWLLKKVLFQRWGMLETSHQGTS